MTDGVDHEDDRLREALRRNAPTPQAPQVLRQLAPAMRRSRSHRRIAMGTATAVLLLGGGAGVLAVNATLVGPDEGDPMTQLPTVTGATESTSTTSVTSGEPTPAVATPDPSDESSTTSEPNTAPPPIDSVPAVPPATSLPAVAPPTSAGAVTGPAPAAPTTQPEAGGEVPTVPESESPSTTSPPTGPASTTTRTVSSRCGDVVIAIDGQRIHVGSLAPATGFISQVSHDGPETVELLFVSASKKCEIHVESNADGLHIEVQDDS